MRIVVTGANGQLGQAVMRQFHGLHDLSALGHADIELSEARTADTIAALRSMMISVPSLATRVTGSMEPCARAVAFAARTRDCISLCP